MAASDDPVEMVFHEVQDQRGSWHIFEYVGGGVSIPLPEWEMFGYHFAITKFMILEVIAALIILAIFIPLSKKIREGGLPKGVFWNFFESILMFVRDEIARPNLDDPHPHHAEHGHGQEPAHASEHAPISTSGEIDRHAKADHGHAEGHAAHAHAEAALTPEHAGDKFVPFLWTLFMFILVTNLLGLIPFLGSPTASIWVTGALAVMIFIILHAVPTAARGNPLKYLASIYPHIDLGSNLGARIAGGILGFGIFCIELLGTAIKSFVLAVRLFANMFAGHMVLGIILMFIYTVGNLEDANGNPYYGLWTGVTFASVLGVVALSLLELFVAFLQAYVFTFLTALFLGMNLYPEH
jgi:F-type H+-transporting ATPase subunit a